MLSTLVFASLLAGAAAIDYTPEALADQVVNLPGTEALDITFNQFSGYVKASDTKNLHYWMVESKGNPETDPGKCNDDIYYARPLPLYESRAWVL